MISPRSYMVSRRKQLLSPPSPSPSPASSPSHTPLHTPLHTPSTSPSTSPCSRSSSPSAIFQRNDDLYTWDATPRLPRITTSPPPTAAAPRTATAVPRHTAMMGKTCVAAPEPTAVPVAQQAAATREANRPTTPTSPVEIPIRSSRHETAHAHAPHHRSRRHFRQACEGDARRASRASRASHSPESIPPSVAALLAATSIPSPRSTRSLRSLHQSRRSSGLKADDKSMRLDAIVGRTQEAEQKFSLSLSKSPLDVLLTPPEDLEDDGVGDGDDDEVSASDSTLQSSVLSTRTVSLESMPSLADSFASGTSSSVETPCCTPRRDRCKARPQRRSLTPVSSPPGVRLAHPLSADADADDDVDSLDFRVFESSPDGLAKTTARQRQQPPVKSAFKSNLTASLRALRNAARSFSGFNLTSIPPEDFLTRSLLTIDPRIPYTDERRPPPLEEEPSPALRRYLNPTTGARIDSRQQQHQHQQQHQQQQHQQQKISPAMASASLTPLSPTVSAPLMSATATALPSRSVFTASIQMQTYKVRRLKTTPPPSPSPSHGRAPPTPPATQPRRRSGGSSSSSSSSSGGPPLMDEWPENGPRQRELRENSDFIRIAVMEMSMRRAGKLDDRKPGRARLALPPRKTSSRPYVVGADGVPARWVSVGPDGQ